MDIIDSNNIPLPIKRERSTYKRKFVAGYNKSGTIKPSTEYSYMCNFHKFWKWLSDNYPETIEYIPPFRSLKKIEDFLYLHKPPIRIELITPKIFFEYIGASYSAKYPNVIGFLKLGIKYIFKVFNMEESYFKFMTDIRNEELYLSGKYNSVIPPAAKRSQVNDGFIPTEVIEDGFEAVTVDDAVVFDDGFGPTVDDGFSLVTDDRFRPIEYLESMIPEFNFDI